MDDGFWFHPKTIAAGNAAVGAFCRLGCWSSQQLTEGHIPASQAKVIGTSAELRKLVEVGYLHKPGDACRCLADRPPDAIPVPGKWLGYWMHDFLEYNPTRAKVVADRAVTAERVRRYREARRAAGAAKEAVAS